MKLKCEADDASIATALDKAADELWEKWKDDPGIAIGASSEFINELKRDVLAIFEKLKQDDIQPLRRALCRSVFQFIDGVSFHLRCSVLLYESPALVGPNTYLNLLRMRTLVREGKVELLIQRSGFREDLHFAFDTYGWTAGTNIDLRKDRKSWSKFVRSIAVRNRVVHPRSLRDLNIANVELKEAIETFVWVNNRLRTSYMRAGLMHLKQMTALRRSQKQMREVAKRAEV